MAKPTYNSYERFNIFDTETHEWLKGLTRIEFADFVLGKLKTDFGHSYQPGCHKVQHEIHCPDGVYIQGYVPNLDEKQFSGVRLDSGNENPYTEK